MDKKTDDKANVIFNPATPTIYADHVGVIKRRDETVLLSFLQEMPNGHYSENSRVLLSKPHLKLLIDRFAEISDYYPDKKETDPADK